MVLIFRLNSTCAGNIKELAYVQYMQVTNDVSSAYRELGCGCLLWSTTDEEDRTLNISHSLRRPLVKEGECHGLDPSSYIVSTINMLSSNIAIYPFTGTLIGHYIAST